MYTRWSYPGNWGQSTRRSIAGVVQRRFLAAAETSSQSFFIAPQYLTGSVLACATCGESSYNSSLTSNPAFRALSAWLFTSSSGINASFLEYTYNLGVVFPNHGKIFSRNSVSRRTSINPGLRKRNWMTRDQP